MYCTDIYRYNNFIYKLFTCIAEVFYFVLFIYLILFCFVFFFNFSSKVTILKRRFQPKRDRNGRNWFGFFVSIFFSIFFRWYKFNIYLLLCACIFIFKRCKNAHIQCTGIVHIVHNKIVRN